jgi:transcription elongation factor GreB
MRHLAYLKMVYLQELPGKLFLMTGNARTVVSPRRNFQWLKSIDHKLMGRYREPAEKKSPYITREGYVRLQQEEKAIWKRRREVTAALAAAAAEGDRSENAEYIYRKKELREIDRRIRYMQKRMPDLKVIDAVPDDPEVVFFGAWVTLEDSDGKESNYRIVGPDEFDVEPGYISMDSPMAKALFKRRIDDEVTVQTPAGKQLYLVTDVRYNSTSN